MRNLFILILIMLLCCSAGENGRIVVIDAHTGDPVEGAVVHLKTLKQVVRTDPDGVAALPEGAAGDPAMVFARGYGSALLGGAQVGPVRLEPDSSTIQSAREDLQFDAADSLRGSYGPFRANNDLVSYDLDIRLEIGRKFLSGSNRIRFRMIEDARRIQIDLFENMAIDSIRFEGRTLEYQRLHNAVFVDFPRMLKTNELCTIDFHYSGFPLETGRFGGIAFKSDSLGNPWVYTACQGIGASLWWPNKDQQRDEVDSMTLAVAVPDTLMDVSNGRLVGIRDLGDGYRRYDWKIHYPINNYCVSLNVGAYTHFADTLDGLTLDYFVLPYHMKAAQRQFAQVKPMMACFQKHFGEYPFPRDGYKLIEVPYSGMEHQSAVTYGNLFRNGYLNRDWTGVDISTRFDFIIIHESGHEWFGNSITCNDVSDAWIQEGWCTYAEAVYVECMFGYEDALLYVNGYKSKVRNEEPIIGPSQVNHWPTSDQYFKGALFLNTLRHTIGDGTWWALVSDYHERFRYRNIYTTDVINFFNSYTGMDLTPVFRQYLYERRLPVIQLQEGSEGVRYRWVSAVEGFEMPVHIEAGGVQYTLSPEAEWQNMEIGGVPLQDVRVLDERTYIAVEKELE